jgi:pimeloyl-ACP methyl ester carboxylesterase
VIAAPETPSALRRLQSLVAAGVDTVAMRAARLVVDTTVMPGPADAQRMHAAGGFYRQPAFVEEPRRFFGFLDADPPPPELPEARTRPLRSADLRRERARLTFRSDYRPVNPAFAGEHARLTENRIVHAEVWRHRDAPARATVIALHGFGMGNPTVDAQVLMAPALFKSGLDVVLLTLPLHGARSPHDARVSGQLFASADVARLNEAIGQAVHDVAQLVAWVRQRNQARVGVLGLSLGGYVAALLASLLPDLDFVIPVVAPVCFGDLAHRFMSASAHYRGQGAALTRAELRELFRVHSPLAHPPRVPRERLLIVAGRGDRIVPPEHAMWLHEHWGAPRIHWFAGSHLLPLGRGGVLHAIRRFLADLGAADRAQRSV